MQKSVKSNIPALHFLSPLLLHSKNVASTRFRVSYDFFPRRGIQRHETSLPGQLPAHMHLLFPDNVNSRLYLVGSCSRCVPGMGLRVAPFLLDYPHPTGSSQRESRRPLREYQHRDLTSDSVAERRWTYVVHTTISDRVPCDVWKLNFGFNASVFPSSTTEVSSFVPCKSVR